MSEWILRYVASALTLSIGGTATGAEASVVDHPGVRTEEIAPARETASPYEQRRLVRSVLRIDNDLFAGRGDDRDYTGGFALTVVDGADLGVSTVNRAIQRWFDEHIGDRLTAVDDTPELSWTALRAGVQAFTPGDIESELPQFDDRPYADLIYLGTSRYVLQDGARTLHESTLTLGALGLGVASTLQSRIHDLTGSAQPRGYRYQIADGGEPTLRYEIARHTLVSAAKDNERLQHDLKLSVAGSVGYLTEGSAALQWRFGRIATAWWADEDESAGLRESAPARGAPSELYFIAGARLHVRLYSALLQGQFRDSDVVVSASTLRRVVGEAWVGGVMSVRNVRVSYTVRYQSSEMRRGVGARSSSWAEIGFTRGSR